jgi:hypothetical protein
MDTQIVAEARGVSRKKIPLETFRSIYLWDFQAQALPELNIDSVKNIGKGDWVESQLSGRLRQALSKKVRCPLCAFICNSVLY